MGVVFFLVFIFILALTGAVLSFTGIILKSFVLRKKNKVLISIFSKLSIFIGCVIGFIAFLFIIFIVIISVTNISKLYNKNKTLEYCVKVGSINQVEKLLEDGVPPDCDKDNNPAGEGMMSAFTYACYGRNPENDVEIVKLMLDYGADINRVTWDTIYNHSEETHLTDSFKEEYPYGDTCGYTPLMYACEGGSYNIVKLLVEQGADINAVSYCGFTPLFVAANSYESRSDEIVEYLIEQGADTQIECFTGETAAEFVRRKGNTHMSELINSYVDEQYD